MFLIANEASDGIFGEYLIIFKAKSFKLSNKARDSFDGFKSLFSSNSSILAIKYGSS